MHSHWSLVAFTLLVQTTAGSLWQLFLALLLIREPLAPRYFQVHIGFLLILLAISLLSAMAHLGKPQKSINSARNVTQSWLSKEIISVNLFAGVLVVITAAAALFQGVPQSLLLLSGSLAGAFALYTMTRIYLIRTVPAWNHTGTPLTFFGSACLLGSMPALVLFQFAGATVAAAQQAVAGAVVMGFCLLGVLLKILAARFIPYGKLTGRQQMMPILQVIGVGILALILQLESLGSAGFPLFVLPVAIICVGEYLNRKQFYESYRRVGL